MTPLHTIEPGFAIAPDSIIGKFLRNPDRPRMAVRESYRKSEGLPFSPLEPSRKIGSLAIVPLVVEDEIIGAVCVEGDEEAQVTAVEGELLSMLAPVASVALKNVEQLQDVTQKSNHDALTGLANRRQFEDRLRHHLLEHARHRQPVSLILLDIDMFKTVNDIYGHQGGDDVLVEVAQARRRARSARSICARATAARSSRFCLPQTNLAGAVAHGGAAARCGVAAAGRAAERRRADHGDGVVRRRFVHGEREGGRSALSRRGHGALPGEERWTELRAAGNVAELVREGATKS